MISVMEIGAMASSRFNFKIQYIVRSRDFGYDKKKSLPLEEVMPYGETTYKETRRSFTDNG